MDQNDENTKVFHRFTKRLTSRQVVITDKATGKTVLAPHVVAALSKVSNKIKALDTCISYLDSYEDDIRMRYAYNSWEILQKDPKQPDTLAYVLYMKQQVSKIRSVVALDAIFGN